MPPKDRQQPWLTLLAEERDLAEPVLEALWFQLFDRDVIAGAFEMRPKTLGCLTTPDAYRRALHDYFASVCVDQPVDPLERAVALHFIEHSLFDLAPEWAVESDDPDVLTSGIYNYMPEDPNTDDSWMDDAPEEEQDWCHLCDLHGLLEEYDDLDVALSARAAMVREGMTPEETDRHLREVVAPFARISERDLEILGVEGCQTPIEVPEDWSEPGGPTDDQLGHDLDELTCRVHDAEGQPTFEESSLGVDGRCIDLTTKASLSSGGRVESYVEVYRLGDDSCHVRLASGGRSTFLRTPPETWGSLARVDEVATAWAELLEVKPAPYSPVEYDEQVETGIKDDARGR